MNRLELSEKSKCCGCSACADSCPAQAIIMANDKEGFLYPLINAAKCVDCGVCRKVCVFSSDHANETPIYDFHYNTPLTYGAKHKDECVRKLSRSGGVFTALSDYILEKKGVIYGCKMDEEYQVVHMRGITKDMRDRFRGSKYCQSDTSNIFKKVSTDLKSGKYVLFSGTSCQTAALRAFLYSGEVIQDKLYCVDILCHGVPSPLLWKKYLDHISKKYRGMVESIEFRDKRRYGWKSHFTTFQINGKLHSSRDYPMLFINDNFLRPACYYCRYKTEQHPSDITLGDYWAVDKALPGFNDNKGISLVLINSEKGKRLFDSAKDALEISEADFDDSRQGIFSEPVKEPRNRSVYWRVFQSCGVGAVINLQKMDILLHRLIWGVKRVIRPN